MVKKIIIFLLIVIALVVIFLLEVLLVIPNHIGIAVILGIVLAVVLALNALISPIIRFYRYRIFSKCLLEHAI